MEMTRWMSGDKGRGGDGKERGEVRDGKDRTEEMGRGGRLGGGGGGGTALSYCTV